MSLLDPRILIYQFLFVATGVFSTISQQYVYYKGGADKFTLFPAFVTFCGMSLAVCLPTKTIAKTEVSSPVPHRKLFLIGFFEVLGQCLSITGLIYAGSGIYQVVYSSVVIFTAIFSKFFLKRQLLIGHWFSILLIALGLSFSAVGSAKIKGNLQLLGIFITVLASIVYASNYILIENILTTPPTAKPEQVQTYSGVYALILTSLYLMCYTIPNFETIFLKNVENQKGDLRIICLHYFLMAVSAFLHSFTYYWLVSSLGAVSVGTLQSMRAVTVFGISSTLFCSEQHVEQCYNIWKGISTVIVITGLIYFSLVKTDSKSTIKEDEA